jgi:transposase-like protein
VLDIVVQDRRDANAAKYFFRRLLQGLQYVPRVVTDKLRSYGVAQRRLLPDVSIDKAGISTTVPRTHTDRRDGTGGR